MARDTDRKMISEALRPRRKEWNQGWDQSTEPKSFQLTLTNYQTTEELEITYSAAGRITKLVHWQLVGPEGQASRQPIATNKRQHVLDVINGGD